MSTTWDPQQYAKFSDHRSRPFGDLMARVGATDPRLVVDLGCGNGPLTLSLAERWPTRASSASTTPPRCWRRRAPWMGTDASSGWNPMWRNGIRHRWVPAPMSSSRTPRCSGCQTTRAS